MLKLNVLEKKEKKMSKKNPIVDVWECEHNHLTRSLRTTVVIHEEGVALLRSMSYRGEDMSPDEMGAALRELLERALYLYARNAGRHHGIDE